MTQPHPQPHCDHECVCPDYRASNSECDEEDPDPCTIPCMQRATHPAAPAEWLCDDCNIIELEERLMNLEQELKDARKDEREKVIEILSDLNKYSCEEYEEASLSDNEREMRIHLEYGNRTWGIIRSLRGGAL